MCHIRSLGKILLSLLCTDALGELTERHGVQHASVGRSPDALVDDANAVLHGTLSDVHVQMHHKEGHKETVDQVLGQTHQNAKPVSGEVSGRPPACKTQQAKALQFLPNFAKTHYFNGNLMLRLDPGLPSWKYCFVIISYRVQRILNGDLEHPQNVNGCSLAHF